MDSGETSSVGVGRTPRKEESSRDDVEDAEDETLQELGDIHDWEEHLQSRKKKKKNNRKGEKKDRLSSASVEEPATPGDHEWILDYCAC
jgi:hypothetical protein